MKTLLIFKYQLLIAGFAVIFGVLSCEKDNRELPELNIEVDFAISMPNAKGISDLKSALNYTNLDEADKVLLTIQNSDGSPTKYTMAELKILKMNEYFYTQRIVLKTGNYILTEFLVLNDANSTIFASPHTGSQEAQNVDNPVPYSFSIGKNTSTTIEVEVISTENRKPEDFGLTRFNILEVETFSFMIGVIDGENGQFITSNLRIDNGSYRYERCLNSIANNIVTIKDNLSNYRIIIEKPGYSSLVSSYSPDSLKCYSNVPGNLPLVLELHKLVTDIDGNTYRTVKIGTQVWMAKNLMTTRYRNGDLIGTTPPDYNVGYEGSAAKYQWSYNGNESYTAYGRYYTWYAITDNRSVCPTSWHIPSDEEWTTLVNFLGGEDVAGGKLKEYGSANWYDPNTGADNSSGFTALPGAYRPIDGYFPSPGFGGLWWSSTEKNTLDATPWYLCYDKSSISSLSARKGCGCSVRCVRD